MTQKAEHDYQSDYRNTYANSDSSNKWILGALAAIAALALIMWLTMTGGPTTSQFGNSSTSIEQQAPAPAVPAQDPAAQPVQPAQPNTGGTANPQ